jgi:prepilin-type N-terminal cleavage/methylation domain-containing protein
VLGRARDEQGFTLIEVLVSMSILSMVMVVVLSAIIQIYGAVNSVDNTGFARDQIANSFRRLDKELRYAEWLSAPGQVGTGWYLEYALQTACRQLEYNNGVLTLASWDPDAATGPAANSATTIASNLALSGSTPPFTLIAVGAKPFATASAGVSGVGRDFTVEHAQIRVQLVVTSGKVTLPFDVVYTANNVDRNTSVLNDCSSGRPAS